MATQPPPTPQQDVILPLEQQNDHANWPQHWITSTILVGSVVGTALYVLYQVIMGLKAAGKI